MPVASARLIERSAVGLATTRSPGKPGLQVVGVDLSNEAITMRAQADYGDRVISAWAILMGRPFAHASLDAVVPNVSLHVFADARMRAVFDEFRRVLRQCVGRPGSARASASGGDELESDYALEPASLAVRYSSRDHVELASRRAKDAFRQRVWRGAARTHGRRRRLAGRTAVETRFLAGLGVDRCSAVRQTGYD
jgi:hypothetical protein